MNDLTKEEFCILNSLYNGSKGRATAHTDIFTSKAEKNSELFNRLKQHGYISEDDDAITDKALEALEPYRVSNAVILAAGTSSRFIPLSIEQPKGLFEVRGEKLIERQIMQLHEAGITDITLVLGYKKEMFFYLKEKYGVTFIFNPAFNIKNNIESLLLAKDKLCNSYICVSDSYYVENPFNAFEYQTLYTGMSVANTSNEMQVETDGSGRITRMMKGDGRGMVLLGHSFWKRDFCEKFISLAEADADIGKYSSSFWEWLVADNLGDMPAMYLKEYEAAAIFEFDYFDDLRKFDTQYLGNTHSEIIRNIKLVFRKDEEDVTDFRNVSEGLTNTSFVFGIDGVDYIYRHPGDGTDKIISRKNEKQSLIQAQKLGIDPTYVYEDMNEGWKISYFVHSFREPEYDSFDDSCRVLEVLRRLHASDVKMDYGLRPWEDSLDIEELLLRKDPHCFEPYYELKEKIGKIYERTVGDGVEKCFCHGDTYKHNWMICPDGDVILIDWEYAGYSDPGIDVGYYIVDAMYDFDEAERFIREYLRDTCSETKLFHFTAYTAIIAYYWFVWALYRESCGAVIGESLENWRMMAEKYANHLI